MASPIRQSFALAARASNARVAAARPPARVRRLIFLFLLPIAAILAAAPLPAMIVRFNLLVLRHLGIG
jgi:hypothetical protein